MKQWLVILFSILSLSLFAQITDITPFKGKNDHFSSIKPAGDSNVHVTQWGNYESELNYIDNKWVRSVIPSSGSVLYFLGKEIYARYKDQSYSYIARWNGTGWNNIDVGALNTPGSSIRSVLLDENNHLVALGLFKDSNSDHYMAKLVDSKWQYIDIPADAITTKAITNSWNWTRNKNGVFYYYIHVYPDISTVLSWNGKNLERLGTVPGPTALGSIAAASNGHVYGGTQGTTDGIMEWNGKEWKLLPCTLPSFDHTALTAVTINEKDEIFVGGNVRVGREALIMKYSNGNWQEFATVPGKTINELLYLKGKLYVITDDTHNIFMLPADKPIPVVKKPSRPDPIDYYAEEVWDIYKDYFSRKDGMASTLNEIIDEFNDAENESQEKTQARRGMEVIKEINAISNESRQSIYQLNIMPGKNILADPLISYITAYQRYANSWNTIFSCYLKGDIDCMDAENKDVKGYGDLASQKREALMKTAEVYKNRNGLD